MLHSFIKNNKGYLPFEGLNTINEKICSYLRKNGLVTNSKNLRNTYILKHVNGFLPLIKPFFSKKKYIISLYSNPNMNTTTLIKNYLEQYILFSRRYNAKRKYFFIKRSILSSLSSLIPFQIKKIFLKKAKYVIVPTNNLKRQLNIKNVRVIPIGIDTKKFKKIPRPKNSKIVVSYFSHAGVTKGFTDLAKAFKLINNKSIEKNLFFSNYSGELKSLNNIKNIKIHGFVKDIVKRYNESDIIVLPYRTANSSIEIPLVLLEAMSCEKAVITTNLPNITEIVGDSARLVNPNSPKQIAKEIILLSKNFKLRNKLGKKARERVIKNYDEEIMFKKYLKLYLHLNKR